LPAKPARETRYSIALVSRSVVAHRLRLGIGIVAAAAMLAACSSVHHSAAKAAPTTATTSTTSTTTGRSTAQQVMRPAIPRFVSLSFSGALHGAGLSFSYPTTSTTGPRGAPRAVVSTTADGGARWDRAFVFPASDKVSALLEVSRTELAAWGKSGLWLSHDGGRRFERVLSHPLGQVGVVGKSVWALGWPCAAGTSFAEPTCGEVLWASSDGGKRFTLRSHLPARVQTVAEASTEEPVAEELQRLGHQVAYVLAPLARPTGSASAHSGGALLVTTDGGRHWKAETDPCASVSGPFGRMDAFGASSHGVLWVACGGQPGAGMESKDVERSVNGGRSWSTVLAPSFSAGYVADLAVLSRSSVVLGLARAEPLWTSDGGQHWTTLRALPRSVVTLAALGPKDLWAWSYNEPGALWRSVDGGKHWTHFGSTSLS